MRKLHTTKVVLLNKFLGMKRVLAFALVVLFVVGLASCGSAEKCPAFIGAVPGGTPTQTA